MEISDLSTSSRELTESRRVHCKSLSGWLNAGAVTGCDLSATPGEYVQAARLNLYDSMSDSGCSSGLWVSS